MRDFTPDMYRGLLRALMAHGRFTLRHDVDRRPDHARRIAEVEAEAGLQATYYFRTVPESFDEDTIRHIAALGHDVGYHYECLTTCHGDLQAAYDDFRRQLERLRRVAPVEKACAHGSPRSRWDSMDLWKHYDYRALGIVHESMLDTDFARTLYLTDTGRRWDGYRMSVRDKVPGQQAQWSAAGLEFHATTDLVRALQAAQHPIHRKELLVNTHPQRWVPLGPAWVEEAALQSAKNIAKRALITLRHTEP